MKYTPLIVGILLTAIAIFGTSDVISQADNSTSTTTTIPAIVPAKLAWLPADIQQEVISKAQPVQNPDGSIILKNGLKINKLSVRNTDAIYIAFDLTGTPLETQRDAAALTSDKLVSLKDNILILKIDKQTERLVVLRALGYILAGLSEAREPSTTTTIIVRDEVPDNTRLI